MILNFFLSISFLCVQNLLASFSQAVSFAIPEKSPSYDARKSVSVPSMGLGIPLFVCAAILGLHKLIYRLMEYRNLFTPNLDIDQRDSEGRNAAMWASYTGDIKLFLLLERDYVARSLNFIDLQDSKGNTALHFASKAGNLSMVKILTAKGANLELTADHGRTAVQTAVVSEQEEVFDFLQDAGADVEARDDRRQTALHLATVHRHQGLAKRLIEIGANKDARDQDGNTPLHLAVENRHVRFCGHSFVNLFVCHDH